METVLITGANSGLGFETAKQFAKRGYKVIVVCRTSGKSKDTKSRILELYPDSNIITEEAELSSLGSVKSCVTNLNIPVHYLICNAGISSTKKPEISKDGFELIFSVNHLAHYTLAVELYNKYPESLKSIVTVSSGVHDPDQTKGYFPKPEFSSLREMAYPKNDFKSWKKEADRRYVHSKLCNIWFTIGMANKMNNDSITKINAFNPGFMTGTNLGRNQSFVTKLMLKYMLPLMKNFIKEMVTVEKSAQELIKVSLQSDYTGAYFSGSQKVESSLLSRKQELIDELWSLSEELSNTKLL